jgi:hypothetical protein
MFDINLLDVQAESAAPRVEPEEAAAVEVAIPEIEKAASASGKASLRKRAGRPRTGPYYTAEEKLVRTMTEKNIVTIHFGDTLITM